MEESQATSHFRRGSKWIDGFMSRFPPFTGLLICGVLSALGMPCAQAADLAERAPPRINRERPEPQFVPQVVTPRWTGFYGGIVGGWGFVDSEHKFVDGTY